MTSKNTPCNALLTRRALFGGAIAAAAFGCRSAAGGKTAKGAAKDKNLSVFFSDIHV